MLAHGSRRGRLLRFFGNSRWLSDSRRLELYPPFFFMRIKVLEIADDWRRVRIRLPLNGFSVNPGGVVFGGYQAAVADPVAALACGRIFSGWVVWTRALSVDFARAGNSNLELRFEFPVETESEIREALERRGRADPVFEYAFYREDGEPCTFVRNTVAIRPAAP